MSFKLLREFKEDFIRNNMSGGLVLAVSNKVFDYLVQNEYNAILAQEKELGCKITLESFEQYEDDQFSIRNNS